MDIYINLAMKYSELLCIRPHIGLFTIIWGTVLKSYDDERRINKRIC